MDVKSDLINILNITKEISDLLKEVEQKENIVSEKISNNTADILVYKSILENVIEEYHLICKKIYK
jgi:hypothetical protein